MPSSSRRVLNGSNSASTSSTTTSVPAYKVPKFLRSLYSILQTEDPLIIKWVQNQELVPNRLTAFHILDMERFEREILPKYFKHQKFASFQRQLNNFGFRKWTKTQSSGVCTFSHNCFPPDAARAAVRDHWRMRSPLPNAPLDGSAPPRRIVGNGITKADRKKQQHQQQHQKQQQQTTVIDTAALCATPEVYSSPANSTVSSTSGASLARALRHKAASSHQPPTKTLARPADLPAGLEAFCDDAFRPSIASAVASASASASSSSSTFILPPLPPHHLLATPRSAAYLFGFPPTSAAGAEMENAPAGSFRHSLAAAMGLKTFEDAKPAYPTADAAALHGAFLEPWALDAHNAGLEMGVAFPMDMDWQDGNHNSNMVTPRTAAHFQQQQQQQQQALMHHHMHHMHDRAAPSGVEDFGLDNLLFVE